MKHSRAFLQTVLLLALGSMAALSLAQTTAPATTSTAPKTDTILHPADMTTILPQSVFFRGLSATVQSRNSGGVHFTDDMYVLATMVDTSGYSTAIKQKYQAYLITEVPIEIEGHRLVPGAYGFGFIANDQFIVMDLGGHDLFTTKSTHDADMKRPTPLQIMPGAGGNGYRLYAGRDFITFNRAS